MITSTSIPWGGLDPAGVYWVMEKKIKVWGAPLWRGGWSLIPAHTCGIWVRWGMLMFQWHAMPFWCIEATRLTKISVILGPLLSDSCHASCTVGVYETAALVGKQGGFWDKVEPCLCRDGHRVMGLMGWWWKMKMSGNRHPLRVGPVRDAYWGTWRPIITSAVCAALRRSNWGREEYRKKGGTLQLVSHTSETLLVYYSRVRPEPAAPSSEEPIVYLQAGWHESSPSLCYIN